MRSREVCKGSPRINQLEINPSAATPINTCQNVFNESANAARTVDCKGSSRVGMTCTREYTMEVPEGRLVISSLGSLSLKAFLITAPPIEIPQVCIAYVRLDVLRLFNIFIVSHLREESHKHEEGERISTQ